MKAEEPFLFMAPTEEGTDRRRHRLKKALDALILSGLSLLPESNHRTDYRADIRED